MQSPRSAVAVSLPLLQRSGLSASHPDQSASVDANVGLVPTQSPPLIGINSPAGVLLARGRCRGGTTIVAPPTLMSRRVRQCCHKLPFRGPLLRAPLGGDHTGWHERTNDCHPSHVRVDSCPNVQLTPTSAIHRPRPAVTTSDARTCTQAGRCRDRRVYCVILRRRLRLSLHPRPRTHALVLRGHASTQALPGSLVLGHG